MSIRFGNYHISIESVNSPGGLISQDLEGYVVSDQTVSFWVLDGASPAEGVPGFPYDATCWYVATVSEMLEFSTHSGVAEEILRSVIRKVNYQAQKLQLLPLSNMQRPLASLSWLRLTLTKNHLMAQFSYLGDTIGMMESPEIGRCSFRAKSMEDEMRLYQEVALMKKSKGYSQEQLNSHFFERLVSARLRMQTECADALLGWDDTFRYGLQKSEFEVDSRFTALLASDGLFRLVDVYQCMSSDELFELASQQGLGYLLSRLRSIEDGDDTATRYPRLKLRDDACGILVKLEKI